MYLWSLLLLILNIWFIIYNTIRLTQLLYLTNKLPDTQFLSTPLPYCVKLFPIEQQLMWVNLSVCYSTTYYDLHHSRKLEIIFITFHMFSTFHSVVPKFKNIVDRHERFKCSRFLLLLSTTLYYFVLVLLSTYYL
jgi:hypothetical protein